MSQRLPAGLGWGLVWWGTCHHGVIPSMAMLKDRLNRFAGRVRGDTTLPLAHSHGNEFSRDRTLFSLCPF